MSPSIDLTIPIPYTIVQYGLAVATFLAVIAGIAWTLRHRPTARGSEKAAWVIVQVVLPILGFLLWLLVAPRPRKGTLADSNQPG